MTIYLDNAATTYPKPASVYGAVRFALEEVGASPGRASHRLARLASSMVQAARERAADFFGVENHGHLLFTKNATESINVVLKGWLRPGDRVLTSSLEHNAVVRPLKRLSETGVTVERIPCSPEGTMDLDALLERLNPPPRLVVLTHASNVNGALQPVPEVARSCADRGVPLFLDAAQTAGIQPIPVAHWDLGMMACSGHKSLLGPPGVGILYIRQDLDVFPLMEGGTGSLSEEEWQPDFCPDRFESGTPNLPGIAGLAAGIDFIVDRGMDSIRDHELGMASYLEDGLEGLESVKVYRPKVRGTGAVSFIVEGMSPSDTAYLLDEAFDIAVRAGLHCAPLAHRALGSYPEGTVRVSPGYSTTPQDVEKFLAAMQVLISRRL